VFRDLCRRHPRLLLPTCNADEVLPECEDLIRCFARSEAG
jgi:hypothetical protein